VPAHELQRQCDEWNRLHRPGDAVIVLKDTGLTVRSTTRSEASVFGGHSAVIWVNGISGCYALDRVWPAPVEAPAVSLPVDQAKAMWAELRAAGLGEGHQLIATLRTQILANDPAFFGQDTRSS